MSGILQKWPLSLHRKTDKLLYIELFLQILKISQFFYINVVLADSFCSTYIDNKGKVTLCSVVVVQPEHTGHQHLQMVQITKVEMFQTIINLIHLIPHVLKLRGTYVQYRKLKSSYYFLTRHFDIFSWKYLEI